MGGSARGFVDLITLVVALSACHPGDTAGADTRLDEFAAVALPSGFIPTGAVVSDDTTALLWSYDGRAILLSPAGHVDTLVHDAQRDRPIAGAFIDDSSTQIVDTLRRAIITYRGAHRLKLVPYSLRGGSIQAAMRGALGWIAATVDSAGSLHLTSLEEAGGTTSISLGSTHSAHGLRGAEVALVRVGDDVLVTLRRPPHTLFRVNARLHVEQLPMAWPPALAAMLESDTASTWVAASTVPIGDRLVQTLTELQSDARILITYSRDGEVVRYTALEAPFALAASSDDGNIVLGFRGAAGQEIVFYSASGH
jgi:hypothetical protein